MANGVTIRELTAPPWPLSDFDPGAYFAGLTFDPTGSAVTDVDRDGLARLARGLAAMAVDAGSSRWSGSVIARGTSAYQALQSHFGHLPGWDDLAGPGGDLPYPAFDALLARWYPPPPLRPTA